ncbi:MAG: hypothetical protein ACI9YB_002321, partial [Halioglobus sp.]
RPFFFVLSYLSTPHKKQNKTIHPWDFTPNPTKGPALWTPT